MMESIYGGGWTVYLLGAVKYADLYDPKNLKYETTYCFMLKPVPLMPNPGGPVEYDTVLTCPFGNTFK